MTKLPDSVMTAWNERESAVVFSTVDGHGNPNSIYATCVGVYGASYIVVADNYFSKTRNNIQKGTKGAVLFITKSGKAYQVKGAVTYHTEGPIFDDMKKWNPTKHPGHAAAAIAVEEIYSGSQKLL